MFVKMSQNDSNIMDNSVIWLEWLKKLYLRGTSLSYSHTMYKTF